MSLTADLNWLAAEQAEIHASAPTDKSTEAERAEWWYRLANWWHRREIRYRDGDAMKRECTIRANRLVDGKECEFCGDPATTVEVFDRAVFVCDQCKA